MRKARLFSAVLAGTSAAFLASSAFGQLMGTVFLDFDGHNGAPQGNVTALNASIFPGLAAGDTANLRAAILAGVQADYAPYSINIVDTDPGGTFTRVVVGNNGTVETGALGVANEIDFRNKRFDNIVSVLADVHANPPVGGPGNTYTLAQAAQFMTNTASHELGHVLGLTHSAPVSTFESGGSPNVRQREIMKARQADPVAFNNLTFGSHSDTKLQIAQNGVNVQPEVGAAVFTGAAAADPARAGDAGATVAAGTALTVDTNGRCVALGTLGGGDVADVYTFAGTTGQRVIGEAFSQTLRDLDGAASPGVGRIANPMNPVVELIDALGTVIAAEEYTANLDIDGSAGADAGSDSMIFNFLITANGNYGLRVTPRGGGDATGDYELLFIPEPGSALLLAAAAGLMTLRRCRA
jgi:hypothetical protein